MVGRLALAGLIFGSVSCQSLLDLGTQPTGGGSDAGAPEPTSPDAAVAVGSACRDLRSDSLHCGRCEHSCLGDPCIEGACQPTALAMAQGGGYGVDVDDNHVYWSSSGNRTVSKIAKNATNGAPIVLMALPERFQPLDVRLDGPFVVVVDGQSGNGAASAHSVSVDGGLPLEHGRGCASDGNLSLAVDSASIYFVNATAGSVYRAAKVTGGCAAIVSGLSAPSSVVVDATSLFVTNETSTTGGLMTAPKSGGPATPIAGNVIAAARGVAADGNAPFVATTDGRIVRVNKDGSGFVELAKGGLHPTHLAVDDTSVFWSDSGLVWAADKVMGIPRVIATRQPEVSEVAVDRGRVYWATSTSIMRVAK